jgi:hypothetical protein
MTDCQGRTFCREDSVLDFGYGLLQPGFFSQYVGLVRSLPGQIQVSSAKMAVGGSLTINGTAQVQSPYDRLRTEVEMLADET